MTIRVDVWGGKMSCDLIARFHLSSADALLCAGRELQSGYLVNMRVLSAGEGWGRNEDFDMRAELVSGHA